MANSKIRIGLGITGLTFCVGLAVFLIMRYSAQPHAVDSRRIHEGKTPAADLTGRKKQKVYLYFADETGTHLVAEDRLVVTGDDALEIGRLIIDALIQGSKGELVRTIPVGTELNAVYITESGRAFLDFSAVIRERHPGGSQTELLTVFSIVNSIVLNIPQVRDVKILIEGREALTLAGHIDLTAPLTANMVLIR